MKTTAFLLSALLATTTAALLAATAAGQPVALAPADVPAVSLTASASLQVDNDRMTIVLQSESEKPSAAAAATEVNAKMGQALARAKAVAAVTAKTVGYSTDQVLEKGRMVRWRVTQLLQIETADFTAGATLATKLQEDGLLLSSLTFSVSPEARRKATGMLQHEALTEWRSFARQAAASMGFAGYTPGRLLVNAGDSGPRPRYAAAAMTLRAAAPEPVNAAAGSSEMTVTVTGEALLRSEKGPGSN